ncbi:MAG: hypothetical protein ACE5EK_04745 [Nitrospinales bacterium]
MDALTAWLVDFMGSLPPLLLLVFGGIMAAGVFMLAIAIANWLEAREKK